MPGQVLTYMSLYSGGRVYNCGNWIGEQKQGEREGKNDTVGKGYNIMVAHKELHITR